MRFVLGFLAILVCGCGGADRVEPEPLPAPPPGRWRAAFADPDSLTPGQRETMDRLRSIGYVSGSRPPRAETGVTLYDSLRTAPGANLVVSGHEAGARLLDARGTELHRWAFRFTDAFPNYDLPGDAGAAEYWRRAWLLPEGDVLAIFEGLGLIRVDRDSNLRWAFPGEAHHDLDIAPDGSLFVLTRRAGMLPRINREEPVLEDFITHLTAEGSVIRSFSLLQAFERSAFRHELSAMTPEGDLFHTNTLTLCREPSGPFRAGNALVSLLQLNLLATVDLTREDVVWTLKGAWRAQHEPIRLETGGILLLDNRGAGERSRVLEVDPESGQVQWEYGSTPGTDFYTFDCGSVSRLPNGNTLVVESNAGRAFEVTPEKDVVWEFNSPWRAGPRNAYVATLFDVVRVPPAGLDWLP